MKGKIEYSLIRTFIPSKDHDLSRDFYKDLGFEISWEDKDLVIFGQGRQTFFLQRYYNKVWAENFMMQAFVKDLEALLNHVKELKKKYKMIRYKNIFQADYGLTFHLIGPSGELWHMMQSD